MNTLTHIQSALEDLPPEFGLMIKEDYGWRRAVELSEEQKKCTHNWEHNKAITGAFTKCTFCAMATNCKMRIHCIICKITACPMCASFYLSITLEESRKELLLHDKGKRIVDDEAEGEAEAGVKILNETLKEHAEKPKRKILNKLFNIIISFEVPEVPEFKIRAIIDTGATSCYISIDDVQEEAREALTYSVVFNGVNSVTQSRTCDISPTNGRILRILGLVGKLEGSSTTLLKTPRDFDGWIEICCREKVSLTFLSLSLHYCGVWRLDLGGEMYGRALPKPRGRNNDDDDNKNKFQYRLQQDTLRENARKPMSERYKDNDGREIPGIKRHFIGISFEVFMATFAEETLVFLFVFAPSVSYLSPRFPVGLLGSLLGGFGYPAGWLFLYPLFGILCCLLGSTPWLFGSLLFRAFELLFP
ncbi:hypothetical protein M5K25_012768 [Dendrobium thyrsiflorum]|uniref:Peptidase A2 domain-containing protein n=1 Tax=Dendrobium thyrsiflorum TaxID=117978 RepID=A0ABD0UYB0_DENTH